MLKRQGLSFPLSFTLAFVVTCVIFIMMYRIIHTENNRDQIIEELPIVELYQPEEQEEEPEEEEKPEEEPEEPLMPELVFDAPVSAPQLNVDIPPMSIDMGSLDIKASGTWSPPAMGEIATGNSDSAGKRNTGFRTIIPRASRQPNVPRIAWDNKIDGWVLVSFVVYNDGRVGKIRVMDSYPRGVFEENVIASVERWLYETFKGPPIQLTQKIELFWKDYPNNIQQLR